MKIYKQKPPPPLHSVSYTFDGAVRTQGPLDLYRRPLVLHRFYERDHLIENSVPSGLAHGCRRHFYLQYFEYLSPNHHAMRVNDLGFAFSVCGPIATLHSNISLWRPDRERSYFFGDPVERVQALIPLWSTKRRWKGGKRS